MKHKRTGLLIFLLLMVSLIPLIEAANTPSEDLIDEYSVTKYLDSYKAVYEKELPLVSVCIGTYNRAKLLVERSIPSVLNQTYEKLELIVVGDCCTDDTESSVSAIGDNRLKFINLEDRGDYPGDPVRRWMVAGTKSINYALKLSKAGIKCKGKWEY